MSSYESSDSCSGCNADFFRCSGCRIRFNPGDVVGCDKEGGHFCDACANPDKAELREELILALATLLRSNDKTRVGEIMYYLVNARAPVSIEGRRLHIIPDDMLLNIVRLRNKVW